jgi:hypothetical protein
MAIILPSYWAGDRTGDSANAKLLRSPTDRSEKIRRNRSRSCSVSPQELHRGAKCPATPAVRGRNDISRQSPGPMTRSHRQATDPLRIATLGILVHPLMTNLIFRERGGASRSPSRVGDRERGAFAPATVARRRLDRGRSNRRTRRTARTPGDEDHCVAPEPFQQVRRPADRRRICQVPLPLPMQLQDPRPRRCPLA